MHFLKNTTDKCPTFIHGKFYFLKNPKKPQMALCKWFIFLIKCFFFYIVINMSYHILSGEAHKNLNSNCVWALLYADII